MLLITLLIKIRSCQFEITLVEQVNHTQDEVTKYFKVIFYSCFIVIRSRDWKATPPKVSRWIFVLWTEVVQCKISWVRIFQFQRHQEFQNFVFIKTKCSTCTRQYSRCYIFWELTIIFLKYFSYMIFLNTFHNNLILYIYSKNMFLIQVQDKFNKNNQCFL